MDDLPAGTKTMPQRQLLASDPDSIKAQASNQNFDELYAGEGGKFITVVDAGTSRTLAKTDNRKYLRFTSNDPVTVTVPAEASIAWQSDVEIVIQQAGDGQVTIAGDGFTIETSQTLKTRAQYSIVGLKRVAADTWAVAGDMEAA